MKRFFAVINGPNLNWLGKREPEIYGDRSWEEIWKELEKWGRQNEIRLEYFQSNHEGALIDYLQAVAQGAGGVLFNPGAFAHTSIALRDGVAMLSVPVVEVHISAVQKREPFRRHSYLADVCDGTICGFGWKGYVLGLELLRARSTGY